MTMLRGHLHLLTHSFQIGEARRKLFKLIKAGNRRKWKLLYTHLVSLVYVAMFCYSPSLSSGLLYYLFYHITSGNGEYDQVKCCLRSTICYYMILTMCLGFANCLCWLFRCRTRCLRAELKKQGQFKKQKVQWRALQTNVNFHRKL